jgi:ferritin
LQWFITEQVEEEKVASDIVERLKMIGSKGDALLLLDRDLGARSAVPADRRAP